MKKQPLIDLMNYEIFVIDYLDGQLSKPEEEALLSFLDEHPHLKEEVEGLELATLEPQDILSDFKESLKKTPITAVGDIDEHSYETAFIAATEKDLNQKQSKNLEQFLLANPMLQGEFDLHKKLILQADQDIVFTEKESLKKRKVLPMVWISSIAAGLIILFAAAFFLRNNQQPAYQQAIIQYYSSRTTDIISNENQSPELILPQRKLITAVEVISQIAYTAPEQTSPAAPDFNSGQLAMSSLSQKPITSSLTNLGDDERLIIIAPVSQEMLLADAGEFPSKRQSLFSKIIGHQFDRIKEKLSGGKEQEINRQLERQDPGFIRVIDRSILVFNTFTGSETNVEKSYNNTGHLTNYKVAGNNLYVSKPAKSAQVQ